MSEEKLKKQDENAGLGLSIDKKTVIMISLVLLALWVLAGVLTQILPTGIYDMTADGSIIPDTYHAISERLPIWKIVLSPLLCFTSSYAMAGVGIILIIILVGGSFLLLDKSGVLKYIMATLIRRFEKKNTFSWRLSFSCVCFFHRQPVFLKRA